MPRKKSVEKRPAKGAAVSVWAGYWSRHPQEKAEHAAKARARDERALAKRMAKHKPVLTDIQSNGKYVKVTFVRDNGKVVYGTYELTNADIPADFHKLEFNRAARFAARVAAEDAAREPRPPEPGKSPRS